MRFLESVWMQYTWLSISVPKKTHFLISSSSYSQEDEKMGGCRIVVITIGIRITFNPVYLKVIF